jgi:hypothetical protein
MSQERGQLVAESFPFPCKPLACLCNDNGAKFHNFGTNLA